MRLGLIGLGRIGLEPSRRYERARAGELVHVDVKKLGRIEGIGHSGRHDGEANVSEGIAIGGGTITNHEGGEIYGYGRAVEVEGPAVESWTDSVAGEHGFTEVSHTLEIFGTCPECA